MLFDTTAFPTRARVGWIVALAMVSLASLPPRAAAQCTGDCDGNAAVAINELIVGVNIALGSAAVGSCPSFDANGDGTVAINELIAAVANALNGCPGGGTRTPTPTPETPTSTATQGTPTPTVTSNTPTVTPTIGGVCGNDIIENSAGETCDDGNTIDNDGCPSNCHVAACTVSDQRLRIDVNFATVDPDVFLQGMTLYLRYPDGIVGIAGEARDDSEPVRLRVTSDIFSVRPRDFDYSLRVLLLDPLLIGYNEGTAMTVEFDVCPGATAPPVSAITCTIESATDLDFMDVPLGNVQCTLAAVP